MRFYVEPDGAEADPGKEECGDPANHRERAQEIGDRQAHKVGGVDSQLVPVELASGKAAESIAGDQFG